MDSLLSLLLLLLSLSEPSSVDVVVLGRGRFWPMKAEASRADTWTASSSEGSDSSSVTVSSGGGRRFGEALLGRGAVVRGCVGTPWRRGRVGGRDGAVGAAGRAGLSPGRGRRVEGDEGGDSRAELDDIVMLGGRGWLLSSDGMRLRRPLPGF